MEEVWCLIVLTPPPAGRQTSEPEQPVNPSQPLCNAKLYRNVFCMWS